MKTKINTSLKQTAMFLFVLMLLSTSLLTAMDNSIYGISAKTIDGETKSIAEYKGKVMLIVNVASKCGFTKQYKELEAVYRKFKDKGFVILGFPCNQFGSQEPGTNQEIKEFCNSTYNVTFPLFDKIEVNGDNTHPLYKFLKDEKPGFIGTKSIKWNFTKFLVDRNGKVVDRFAPQTSPDSIADDIQKLLK